MVTDRDFRQLEKRVEELAKVNDSTRLLTEILAIVVSIEKYVVSEPDARIDAALTKAKAIKARLAKLGKEVI